MEEEPLNLETLSEKTLHQTIDPQLLAYCPSMDLVAFASTDQQVLIYRLNGQRVYGAAQKGGSLKVESIRWKPNGQMLAIAWSDGSVHLVGAESSKIVHQFSTGDQISGVTCMGWASNLTSRKSKSVSSKERLESWKELMEEGAILSENKAVLDLPRDLTLIDIETSLPKLSVLAAGGTSEDVFSSRSSLDALFRPFDPKDNNAVNVMVVGTNEGHIHITIYDSFVIGSFESPVMVGGQSTQLVLHASHEQYSTHALLMKSSSSQGSLYFVPMDLRFISASSEYLSLLASRSTALQNLLRYIHQVQILMDSEWKGTQELPNKFLRNINETLNENGNRDIVQALYHSVATGHTFPAVREWLVDELTERGLKRWDKAVITGLENLRRLVHENMLPALDRCSVILSRFAGIAKFQGSNDTVGFSSQQISLILDTITCLHLLSSKVLTQVVDELDLFAAFSAWIRYEIDRLATDASTTPDEESGDKEASIDHAKVLLYLQSAMTTSPLSVYFGESSLEGTNEGLDHLEQGVPIFDLLQKQLRKQEQGLPYMKELLRVELLCTFLAKQANKVFAQIAQAEKRNVLFGNANELGIPQNDTPMDMRMGQVEQSLCNGYIAIIPQGPLSRVQVVQVIFSIENGISTVHSMASSSVQLGDGEVKDMKFLDDNILLLLWESKGVTSLLSLPYQSIHDTTSLSHADDYRMEYSPHNPGESLNPTPFDDEEVLATFSKYKIATEDSFVPQKMEIRGSKVIEPYEKTRRVVFLGKNRLQYKIFKFPIRKPGVDVTDDDEDISMS